MNNLGKYEVDGTILICLNERKELIKENLEEIDCLAKVLTC